MTKDESTLKKSIEKIDQQKIIPSYIDGGYGWVVVFASFGVNFIYLGILCSFSVIFSQLLDEFKETKGYTSLISSLMTSCSAIISPLSSIFVEKYGYRDVTVAGAILGTGSLLVSYYAKNVFTLIITIGLGLGAGLGLTYLPAIVCVNAYFVKYRSAAVGIAVSGCGFGTFISAPIIAHISQEYGWRLTLVILAGVFSTNIIFGILLRQLPTPKDNNEAYELNNECQKELEVLKEKTDCQLDEQNDTTVKVYNKLETPKPTIIDLLKDPIVILLAIASLTTCVGYYVPYFCLTDRAMELGMTKQEGSQLLSILGIANTFGRVFWGYISDKPFVNRLWVFNSTLIVTGVATIACVLCLNFLTLAIYSVVFGFFVGAYVTLKSVVCTDLLGLEKLNSAYGLLLMFEGLGTLFGPPNVGLLHDLTHSYVYGFIFAGAFLGLSGFIQCFIPTFQKKALKNYHAYKVTAQA